MVLWVYDSNGFVRSKFDKCVYFKFLLDNHSVILLLYVDDIFIASNSKFEVEKVKNELISVWEEEFGKTKKELVDWDHERQKEESIIPVLESYLKKACDKFGMTNLKLVSSPLAGILS